MFWDDVCLDLMSSRHAERQFATLELKVLEGAYCAEFAFHSRSTELAYDDNDVRDTVQGCGLSISPQNNEIGRSGRRSMRTLFTL